MPSSGPERAVGPRNAGPEALQLRSTRHGQFRPAGAQLQQHIGPFVFQRPPETFRVPRGIAAWPQGVCLLRSCRLQKQELLE